VLFLAHTDAAPRGFTLLCRRLGLLLAAGASSVLGVALTQEWATTEAARLEAAFARLSHRGEPRSATGSRRHVEHTRPEATPRAGGRPGPRIRKPV